MLLTSIGNYQYDPMLIKVDDSGAESWRRSYVQRASVSLGNFIPTADGGYAMVGKTYAYDQGRGEQFWMMKVDDQGNEAWTRTWGDRGDDRSWFCQQTGDNGFILVGSTDTLYQEWSDSLLLKTDSQGQEQWRTTFGAGSASRVWITDQGGYVLCAHSREDGESDHGKHDEVVHVAALQS